MAASFHILKRYFESPNLVLVLLFFERGKFAWFLKEVIICAWLEEPVVAENVGRGIVEQVEEGPRPNLENTMMRKEIGVIMMKKEIGVVMMKKEIGVSMMKKEKKGADDLKILDLIRRSNSSEKVSMSRGSSKRLEVSQQ